MINELLKNLADFLKAVYFVYECSTCMPVCAPRVCWCPRKSDEAIRSPETGVVDSCQPCVGAGN